MENRPFAGLDGVKVPEVFAELPTPCYVLDAAQLQRNGEVLLGVQQRTGCKILLAQKAFSNYDLYPLLSPYLAGTEASGLFEARLGREEMPEGEVHVFCGAYRAQDFAELLTYADHIVFNSPHQLKQFGLQAKAAGRSIGLRINPECSTQDGHAIYDPCAPGSRLGTTRAQWDAEMTPEWIGLLDGLHFHTLCEQDADALEVTVQAVEEKFGHVLGQMQWLNLGGGHHITRPGYDLTRLERCLLGLGMRYPQLQLYLEPGEACALNAGYLVTEVLDVLQNADVHLAILEDKPVSRFQLVSSLEERFIHGGILESQIRTQRIRIDFLVPGRMLQEGFDFRSKDQIVIVQEGIVQRLDAEVISGTIQPVLSGIRNHKGKHAAQPFR